MLALWIILAVLAFLALVCSLSVVLYVNIGETTQIQVGIAGLRFTLVDTREESPRQKVKALKKEQKKKEKEAKKKAKEKRKAQKKRAKAKKKRAKAAKQKAKVAAQAANQSSSTSAPAGEKSKNSPSKQPQKADQDEDGFTTTVKKIVALIRRCFPRAKYILRHLRFRRVIIAINVGAEDAHTTAIRYGQVQAGVNTTLGILAGYGADLKLDTVCIQPDFITGEFRQWINFRVKLRIGVIIVGGLGILGKIIGYFLAENRPDSPDRPVRPSNQTPKTSAGQAVKQENAR